MLTQNEKGHGIYKFIVNEHDMTTSLFRESYYPTAANLAYSLSKYYAPLNLSCSATKFFFDGVCIETSQCPNVIYHKTTYYGIQNTVYWNTVTLKCETC